MSMTTLSSRQFNQDASRTKEAAQTNPVFITDHGKPAYVLLTFDEYKKMIGTRTKIADLLAMPGIEDLELEIPQSLDVAQLDDVF
ncbi:MAG: type II toxin-antitoxin system Phd/YefM family antitoxin [Nitrospirae bacterium]|nr:type II toxin-antitoxin system Phd/YefM family antitoxin [Magnetococcales bacterium]